MTNGNKKIEEYFNEARSDEPALSLSEARSLVEGLPVGAGVSPFYTKINKGVKPMHIISSIFTLAAAAGIFFHASIFNGSPELAEKKNNSVSAYGISANSTNAVIAENIGKDNDNTIPVSGKKDEIIAENNKSPESFIEKHATPKQLQVKGVNVIELDGEELKRLGVVTNSDNSLKFLALKETGHPVTISLLPSDDFRINHKNENPDDKTMLSPRFVTDNNGNRKISLFSNDEIGMIQAVTNSVSAVGDSIEFGHDLIVSAVNRIVKNGREADRINKTTAIKINPASPNVMNCEMGDSTRKIVMKIITAADTSLINIPNDKLLSSEFIPHWDNANDEMNVDFQNASDVFKDITVEMKDGKIMIQNEEIKIPGDMNVNFLDSVLQNCNLPKMNRRLFMMINMDSNCAINKMTPDSAILCAKRFEFVLNNDSNRSIDEEFMNVMIKTPENGLQADDEIKQNKLMFIDDNIESYLRINKLIPIAVGFQPDNIDYILWYDPSPELVSLLPSIIREKLEQELNALNTNDFCNNDAVAGEETYADVWRSCSGAIENLNVFPNPTSGKINVSYSLKNSRRIAIAVHDLSGRKIYELAKYSEKPSGAYQENFTLKNVKPGMYLISIQTEDGEQAVQRVIVE